MILLYNIGAILVLTASITSALNDDRCFLAPDPGPCLAVSVRYFYNPRTSRCEPFQYGGCMGNRNNFATRRQCETTCQTLNNDVFHDSRGGQTMQKQFPPATVNICQMPRDPGQCFAKIPAWYFDSEVKNCQPFLYSGCGGNKNLFPTRDDCMSKCSPFITPWQLPQLPPQSYPATTTPLPSKKCFGLPYVELLANGVFPACTAILTRYQFNQTTKQCERFIYGGCPAVDNMFMSIEECTETCSSYVIFNPTSSVPAAPPPCVAIPDYSECSALEVYRYNATSQKCERGCSSRNNRFPSLNECIETCQPRNIPGRSSFPPPICFLPPDSGSCFAQSAVYYFYSASSRQCQPMSYGGCGGNENRFNSIFQCERTCMHYDIVTEQPLLLTTQPPTDACQFAPDVGPCKASMPMYFYNSTAKHCQVFNYGGCHGNANRFTTQYDCEQKCLPPGATPLWPYYMTTTAAPEYPTTPSSIVSTFCPPDAPFARCNYDPCTNASCPGYDDAVCVPNFCYCTAEFFSKGVKVNSWCEYGNTSITAMPTTRPPILCPPGVYMRCLTDPCETNNCSAFPYAQCVPDHCACTAEFFVFGRNVTDICQGTLPPILPPTTQQPTAPPCPPGVPVYQCPDSPCNYARCNQFPDAVCVPNNCGKCTADFYLNGYKLRECSDISMVATSSMATTLVNWPKSRCFQPVAIGHCDDSLSRYFYNATSGQCQWFSYSGCGGNENIFNSKYDCETACKGVYATVSPSSPGSHLICPPGVSLVNCPPNPCERASCPGFPGAVCMPSRCGQCTLDFYVQGFKIARCFTVLPTVAPPLGTTPADASSISRCNEPMAVGTCDHSIWMYFYNTSSNRCESFSYSGCGGNDNLFSTKVECEMLCNKHSLPTWPPTQGVVCPAGVRIAQCLTNPCDTARCPSYPEANCVPNNCGGCGRDFFVGSWKVTDCYSRDQFGPTTQLSWPSSNACYKPLVFGFPCSSQPGLNMYFYNVTSSQCEQFYYAGCGGNENAFSTFTICNSVCAGISENGMTTPWWMGGSNKTVPSWSWTTAPEKTLPAVCELPPDIGTQCLQQPVPKYYFDSQSGICSIFQWGGCNGNENRFDSVQQCNSACNIGEILPTTPRPPFDPLKFPANCTLPPDRGLCSNKIPAFFFNVTSLQCEPFSYTGCGGNANRFFTFHECQSECTKTVDPSLPLPSPKPCLTEIVVNCLVDPCFQATCPAYPIARCVPNMCGGCFADFYVGAVKVDCSNGPSTDFNSSLWVPPPITCSQEGSGCPVNPCRAATCTAEPSAKCIPNFCNNACSAEFYDKYNRKINCTGNFQRNFVSEVVKIISSQAGFPGRGNQWDYFVTTTLLTNPNSTGNAIADPSIANNRAASSIVAQPLLSLNRLPLCSSAFAITMFTMLFLILSTTQ